MRRAITVAIAPGLGGSVPISVLCPVPDLSAVPVPLEVVPAAVVVAAQSVSHIVHSPANSLALKKLGNLKGILFAEQFLRDVYL